jgi:predicted CoA-binding protein
MSVDDHLIAKILGTKTIAVVGLSKDPARPSRTIAS